LLGEPEQGQAAWAVPRPESKFRTGRLPGLL